MPEQTAETTYYPKYPPYSKPRKKRPLLRRLLIWTFLFFFTIICGLLILSSVFNDKITQKIISTVNNQLTTELSIDHGSLSLFSSFPNAAVNLFGTQLEGTDGIHLLESEILSFRFGLFSLFSEDIRVKEVKIQKGALYVHIDKKGKANYNITKSGEASEGTSAKSINLVIEKALLEDVELIYEDEKKHQAARLFLKETSLSGNFSSTEFGLDIFATAESQFIETEKERYLTGKDLVIDARLDVNLKDRTYKCRECDLGIERNTFKIDGSIDAEKNATLYDLSITGKEGSLSSLIDLLPRRQRNYFNDFESSGTFYFNALIDGTYSRSKRPKIHARFGLKNGSIKSAKLAKKVRDVSFEAVFTNGEKHTDASTVFEISNFKGYFNRELFESSLRISNLKDPYVDFNLDGVLPLAAVYGLLNKKFITKGYGEVEVKDIRLKGKLADMREMNRIHRVDASGRIEFDDAGLQFYEERMTLDKGQIMLKDNSLVVEELELEGAGTEMVFNGHFKNVIPVLFADSLNSRDARLEFTSTLSASRLDLDRLLDLSVPPAQPSDYDTSLASRGKPGQKEQIQRRSRVTDFLKGTFQANIKEYNYNEIKGEDFSGSLSFNSQDLAIKGNTRAMDGRWNLDGTAHITARPYLNAKLIAEAIDVKEFFRQAENFGQNVVKSSHLKGKLDAKLAIDAFWDENGIFQEDKLHVLSDMRITNGQLIGLELLYDFSDYIRMEDLRHIAIQDLRNWLEVKNKKIYLPAMFIQSNALNLTVSGTHSFDNIIDYNFRVNAGQAIINKLKKFDGRDNAIPAKRKGWFNLYYRLYGTVDDYQIKSDKKGVKYRIGRSEIRKRHIQEDLINVFGAHIDLADSPGSRIIPEYEDAAEEDELLDPITSKPKRDSLKKEKPKEELKLEPDIAEDEEEEFIEW